MSVVVILLFGLLVIVGTLIFSMRLLRIRLMRDWELSIQRASSHAAIDAHAPQLNGSWHGQYSFSTGAEKFDFKAELTQQGAKVTGTIKDRLGNAWIRGALQGDELRFVKWYDPPKGKVYYRGKVTADGGMHGHWFMSEGIRNLGGSWAARKEDPQTQDKLKLLQGIHDLLPMVPQEFFNTSPEVLSVKSPDAVPIPALQPMPSPEPLPAPQSVQIPGIPISPSDPTAGTKCPSCGKETSIAFDFCIYCGKPMK